MTKDVEQQDLSKYTIDPTQLDRDRVSLKRSIFLLLFRSSPLPLRLKTCRRQKLDPGFFFALVHLNRPYSNGWLLLWRGSSIPERAAIFFCVCSPIPLFPSIALGHKKPSFLFSVWTQSAFRKTKKCLLSSLDLMGHFFVVIVFRLLLWHFQNARDFFPPPPPFYDPANL